MASEEGERPPGDADNGADGLSEAQLREALRRGVISDAQMDQLIALAREAPEAPKPGKVEISAAEVMYWAGAGAVLFAMGWFLIDRWKSLRPGGVLAMVTLYAAAFTLASSFLSRRGQLRAGSIFALLAVGMAPVAMWAIEALTGIWPPTVTPYSGPLSVDVTATIRWIPIELSAALAGLIALRRVRLPALALTVAIPFALAMIHVTPLVFDPWLESQIWGWMAIVAGAVLLAAGGEVDRRTRDITDFAGFVYLVGLVYLGFGLGVVSSQTRAVPHSLPAVIGLVLALSILTRRGFILLFAGVMFVAYLAFLAADVFATATGFMIVMVAGGGALILTSVLVQKKWPAFAKSFARDAHPRKEFRGARLLYGGIVLASLVVLSFAPARAREWRRKEFESLKRIGRQQAEARRAMRNAGQPAQEVRPTPRETPPRRQP